MALIECPTSTSWAWQWPARTLKGDRRAGSLNEKRLAKPLCNCWQRQAACAGYDSHGRFLRYCLHLIQVPTTEAGGTNDAKYDTNYGVRTQQVASTPLRLLPHSATAAIWRTLRAATIQLSHLCYEEQRFHQAIED